MAEVVRTYTIKDDGGTETVKIADEVVTVIAAYAATEVKGVACIAGGISNSMVPRKGIKSLSRGVKVNVEDGQIGVDLAVCLDYGCSIPEVGAAIQEKVKTAIENMTGMKVIGVNVKVADIAAPED